jgi:hypothetical protein
MHKEFPCGRKSITATSCTSCTLFVKSMRPVNATMWGSIVDFGVKVSRCVGFLMAVKDATCTVA